MREFLELLNDKWYFLVIGYCFTVAIELPILYYGLSDQHSRSRRIFAGLWLTACTYPLVALVVPEIFSPSTERLEYLLVAESIAHFGECFLFYLAFAPLKNFWRDMVTVFSANLASFGLGELMWWALGILYGAAPGEP
jgi:hypothetical protein